MDQTIYCLPLLHDSLESAVSASVYPAGAVRIWPGLPNMPAGYWSAPDYPFDPTAAQDCVKQMESLSEAAMSGVPMQTLASMDAASGTRKKRDELQDIKNFTMNGFVPSSADSHVLQALQAAQKALLWAWLLEEKVLEVKKIMGTYSHDASHIMDALGVEEDEDDKALSFLASLDRNLGNSSMMLPPWPLVLENAALFLPDGACIAVGKGLMADDLQDRLTFSPASAQTRLLWGESGECVLDEARVPLWRALGKTEDRGDHPWRDKNFLFVVPGGCA